MISVVVALVILLIYIVQNKFDWYNLVNYAKTCAVFGSPIGCDKSKNGIAIWRKNGMKIMVEDTPKHNVQIVCSMPIVPVNKFIQVSPEFILQKLQKIYKEENICYDTSTKSVWIKAGCIYDAMIKLDNISNICDGKRCIPHNAHTWLDQKNTINSIASRMYTH